LFQFGHQGGVDDQDPAGFQGAQDVRQEAVVGAAVVGAVGGEDAGVAAPDEAEAALDGADGGGEVPGFLVFGVAQEGFFDPAFAVLGVLRLGVRGLLFGVFADAGEVVGRDVRAAEFQGAF